MKLPRLLQSTAILTTLFVGLSAAPSDTHAMADPTFITRTTCPPLAKYPTAMQLKAARELNALGPTAELPKFMNDYGKLRDACRAIAKRRK